MRNERYILTYIIAILTVLLIITGFGYINYKNVSFNGLSRQTTYAKGKRIKYAGLNWYIVNDNGKHVTLILTNNAKVGPYGDTVSWRDSEAKEFLNDEWIKYSEQSLLKEEIDHGAIVLDSEARSFIRLIRYDEIKDLAITNESNTPFWTMSPFNDKLWYALKDGSLEYTSYDIEDSSNVICYKGDRTNNINDLAKYNKLLIVKSHDTINEPYETNAVVSVDVKSIADNCYKDYKIDNNSYLPAGRLTTYTSDWRQENKVDIVGIRPVITVKKK